MQESALEKFTKWLKQNGSEIQATKGHYEVLRFTTPNGIGLVFRSKQHPISNLNAAAQKAKTAWLSGEPWHACSAPPRTYQGHRKRSLAERDGNRCIYCECLLGDLSKAIVEHIVPRTAGGPDHLSNLALACADCERQVGVMSAAEKIRFAKAQSKAKSEQLS